MPGMSLGTFDILLQHEKPSESPSIYRYGTWKFSFKYKVKGGGEGSEERAVHLREPSEPLFSHQKVEGQTSGFPELGGQPDGRCQTLSSSSSQWPSLVLHVLKRETFLEP